MNLLAILLCGFSIISALSIALIHFKHQLYTQHSVAKVMGITLLLVLANLQLLHYLYLESGEIQIFGVYYQVLLFLVAPTFYLFSRSLLNAENKNSYWQAIHFFPAILSIYLPYHFALPVSFILGMFYLIWLSYRIYTLRTQRHRFQLELVLLTSTLFVAIAVMILGLSFSAISDQVFYGLYSIAIGCALVLINLTLLITPQLASKVAVAAEENYSSTTLTNIKIDDMLIRLEQLMTVEMVYQQSDLSLKSLSVLMKLSKHQLSELVNSKLGKGLSLYIKERRVDAAKKMLVNEKSASVLSVGLSVGFNSQSSFYSAFNDLTGMSPGQYREKIVQNDL